MTAFGSRSRRGPSRVVLAATTILLAASCSVRPAEPAPAALRAHLDALLAGEFDTAYERTSLEDLVATFGEGAAVTLAHFEASWRAHPLERYEVVAVTRLDRRSIDAPNETGTPFFEVDVRLSIDGEQRNVTYTVDGEIAGVVNVEVYGLRIEGVASVTDRIEIDGVQTAVRREAGGVPLLLLPGPHSVTVSETTIAVRADALEVISGPARIVRDRPATISLGG